MTTHILRRLGADHRAPPTTGRSTDILHHYRFSDGYLVSDISADDAYLGPETDRALALRQLVAALRPLYPDLPDSLAALQDRGQAFLLDAQFGTDRISVGGRRAKLC